MAIPTRAAIDGLLLALADDETVNVHTPALRVLRAVLDRIGTDGYCWADAFDIADAARLRVATGRRRGAPATDTAERALRAWAAAGVLDRMEARSGPRSVRRHVLYYCPRLTGIPAPGQLGIIELCDDHRADCEPELLSVDGRPITRGALSAPRLADWELEPER